jgi:hypothetical protein
VIEVRDVRGRKQMFTTRLFAIAAGLNSGSGLLGAGMLAMSCASTGNCGAGGSYRLTISQLVAITGTFTR